MIIYMFIILLRGSVKNSFLAFFIVATPDFNLPECSRCVQNRILCYYSLQKTVSQISCTSKFIYSKNNMPKGPGLPTF